MAEKLGRTVTSMARRQPKVIIAAFFGVLILMLLLLSSSKYSQDEACEVLTNWVIRKGGKVEGLKCIWKEEAAGRGVIASQPLMKSDNYLVIPENIWMWGHTLHKHSQIKDILYSDEKIVKRCGSEWKGTGMYCYLIIALEYEKHNLKNSYWKPYLDTVPFRPTSLTWLSEAELDNLQSATLKEITLNSKKELEKGYNEIMPYLHATYPDKFPKDKHTLESYAASAIHVSARVFQTNWHNSEKREMRRLKQEKKLSGAGGTTVGLIPYADLLNHQSYVDSDYGDSYSEHEGNFSLYASECYSPGAEVYHSYGSHHASVHFLSEYGFIPAGFLKADYITLVLTEEQEETVDKSNPAVGFIGIDGMVYPESFMNTVAEIQAGKEQRTALKAIDGAVSAIVGAIQSTLEDLPTTLEEDYAELRQGFKTYESWVAVNTRVRFKQILHTSVSVLNQRLKHRHYTTVEEGWTMPKTNHYTAERQNQDAAYYSLFTVELGLTTAKK
eukprot:m.1122142 g.1122142  ORF g.1122142 m.1122142 type:complete len:499 (+) comp24401_c1_seq13:99-1595(+)